MTEADGRIVIRLMNEYFVDMPLWGPDDETEEIEQRLSDQLRSDLRAFAARWDAAVPREVFDDRWDGVPVMSRLVRLRYALGRRLHPARERARAAENEAIRMHGMELRDRVQQELGDRYVVRYVH